MGYQVKRDEVKLDGQRINADKPPMFIEQPKGFSKLKRTYKKDVLELIESGL